MRGKNVWRPVDRTTRLASSFQRLSTTTVFISHRSTDKPFASALAEEIMRWGFNVWLDQDDPATQAAAARGDDEALALAIEAGIRASTHLLALLTKDTRGSWWVPYEVGQARALDCQFALTLERNTQKPPEWASLGRIIAHRSELLDWLRSVGDPAAGHNSWMDDRIAHHHTVPAAASTLGRFLL